MTSVNLNSDELENIGEYLLKEVVSTAESLKYVSFDRCNFNIQGSTIGTTMSVTNSVIRLIDEFDDKKPSTFGDSGASGDSDYSKTVILGKYDDLPMKEMNPLTNFVLNSVNAKVKMWEKKVLIQYLIIYIFLFHRKFQLVKVMRYYKKRFYSLK